MALQKILDNIRSFLHLLITAKNEAISWNEQSYRNAFKWAEYCQKIYSQSEGKPYKAQLDNEIKKITIGYAAGRMNFGNLKVELDFFKNSIHLLTMTIVFNDSVIMEEEFLEVVREYFGEPTILKLTNIHSKWQDIQRDIDNIDVSTTLLINFLLTISSLEFCQSENIRYLFKEKLFLLMKSKNGFITIGECYSTLLKLRKCSTNIKFITALQLIQYLLPEFYDSSHNYEKEFLNLCLKDESILKDFMDYLIKLGRTFKIFYNTGKSEIDYYFGWRNDDDNSMSWEAMLNWFDVFLHESNNDDVIMLTSQTLSRAANESDVNVFRTLCNELGKFDFLEEWIFN